MNTLEHRHRDKEGYWYPVVRGISFADVVHYRNYLTPTLEVQTQKTGDLRISVVLPGCPSPVKSGNFLCGICCWCISKHQRKANNRKETKGRFISVVSTILVCALDCDNTAIVTLEGIMTANRIFLAIRYINACIVMADRIFLTSCYISACIVTANRIFLCFLQAVKLAGIVTLAKEASVGVTFELPI